ncbi:MAG: B12-binding domain-containing radical SAM protein, partial [Nitrospinota bacterium]
MQNLDLKITNKKLLAEEKGSIIKHWANRLRVGLIFPNTYQIGMSNLGIHKVYELFNSRDDALCERIFLPSTKQLEFLIKKKLPLLSFETGTELRKFDLLAFSFTTEFDYLNLPLILKLANIPLENRSKNEPIIIAGGIAPTMNPEPIAPFMDAIFIGEGPSDSFIDALTEKDISALHDVESLYIPSQYSIKYKDDQLIESIQHNGGNLNKKVTRSYDLSIIENPTKSVIFSPNTIFGDMALIETGKGCGRRCRFCSSSYSYAPLRFVKKVPLIRAIQTLLKSSDKIGLVGSAIGDYPDKEEVFRSITDMNKSFSVSSLMIDKITKNELQLLQKGSSFTITAAIEAGSQSLRNKINKDLSDDDILRGVDMIAKTGPFNLKLYFLIGLPGESDADILELIALIKTIQKRFLNASKSRGRVGRLIISIDSFVPKALTPFQWEPFSGKPQVKAKFKKIRNELRSLPNTLLRLGSANGNYLQTLLSIGGRPVSEIIRKSHYGKVDWQKLANSSNI